MSGIDQEIIVLTAFQERVLRDYQRSTVKFRVGKKNVRGNLRANLRDWLAQPTRREQYELEVMPTHEQVALIESIITYLQAKRTGKAQETRAANKKRASAAALAARQFQLNL